MNKEFCNWKLIHITLDRKEDGRHTYHLKPSLWTIPALIPQINKRALNATTTTLTSNYMDIEYGFIVAALCATTNLCIHVLHL